MEIKSRNIELDFIRGFAMMWVIFIHCLYWTGIFNQGNLLEIKSLFLIEMPLFIFIIGASNYLSRSENYRDYIYKRLKKAMIPYWVYAILVLILIIDSGFYEHGMIIKWLLPIGNQYSPISYLSWALWFIPVYLQIIIIFPVYKRYFIWAKKTNNRYLRYTPLVIFTLLIMYFTFHPNYVISNFAFYSFFTYLGMFYNELKYAKRNYIIALAIFLVCSSICFFLYKYMSFKLDMQINKFPPNIMFFNYSIAILSILFIFSKYVLKCFIIFSEKNKVFKWLILPYQKFSYSIFLYQSFAFLILPHLLQYFGVEWILMKNQLVTLITYFVLVVPLCTLFGYLFGNIENICNKKNINRVN